MSSNLDFLRAYIDAVGANPAAGFMEEAETYLSDDFQNLGKDGNVLMDKAGYLGLGQLLLAAFKDLKFVYSDLREEGEDVIVSSHFEGTFTGALDLSAMGMGVIPASGKKIVWPDSDSKWKVEGDKIVSIQEITGGTELFLAQLGVKPPSA